ncbi:hypothetical protein IE53DRAFT_94931 [Violaceomyces palustris]|uniref:Uncharacterized protein n=1 Tax=Violaceomyces palustris TaxID=1673888 RepID=A0ACD0NXC3_9BASI|nr:hypothetical protein IE53DRAFT_94931 [Violaceomyces palustris]
MPPILAAPPTPANSGPVNGSPGGGVTSQAQGHHHTPPSRSSETKDRVAEADREAAHQREDATRSPHSPAVQDRTGTFSPAPRPPSSRLSISVHGFQESPGPPLTSSARTSNPSTPGPAGGSRLSRSGSMMKEGSSTGAAAPLRAASSYLMHLKFMPELDAEVSVHHTRNPSIISEPVRRIPCSDSRTPSPHETTSTPHVVITQQNLQIAAMEQARHAFIDNFLQGPNRKALEKALVELRDSEIELMGARARTVATEAALEAAKEAADAYSLAENQKELDMANSGLLNGRNGIVGGEGGRISTLGGGPSVG